MSKLNKGDRVRITSNNELAPEWTGLTGIVITSSSQNDVQIKLDHGLKRPDGHDCPFYWPNEWMEKIPETIKAYDTVAFVDGLDEWRVTGFGGGWFGLSKKLSNGRTVTTNAKPEDVRLIRKEPQKPFYVNCSTDPKEGDIFTSLDKGKRVLFGVNNKGQYFYVGHQSDVGFTIDGGWPHSRNNAEAPPRTLIVRDNRPYLLAGPYLSGTRG